MYLGQKLTLKKQLFRRDLFSKVPELGLCVDVAKALSWGIDQ